jgi:hypothetical protein
MHAFMFICVRVCMDAIITFLILCLCICFVQFRSSAALILGPLAFGRIGPRLLLVLGRSGHQSAPSPAGRLGPATLSCAQPLQSVPLVRIPSARPPRLGPLGSDPLGSDPLGSAALGSKSSDLARPSEQMFWQSATFGWDTSQQKAVPGARRFALTALRQSAAWRSAFPPRMLQSSADLQPAVANQTFRRFIGTRRLHITHQAACDCRLFVCLRMHACMPIS